MNKKFWLLIIVACLAVFAGKIMAEPITTTVPSQHVVVQTNTMWDLAQHYTGNANRWTELRAANPQIKNPNLIRYNHDVLNTPQSWQDEFNLPATLDGKTTHRSSATSPPFVLDTLKSWNWTPWLLGALLLFAVYLAIRNWFQPISRGPRVRPEGIRSMAEARRVLPALIHNQMQAAADASPGWTPPTLRVISITEGRFWGTATVSYASGPARTQVLTGQRGYRAICEDAQGNRSEYYTLAACANDVRAGRGMSFTGRFEQLVNEPVTSSQETPTTSTPPVAPVAPASEPIAPSVSDIAQPNLRTLTQLMQLTEGRHVFTLGDEIGIVHVEGTSEGTQVRIQHVRLEEGSTFVVERNKPAATTAPTPPTA